MSLSDCMYACMHRQHCVLRITNLPTLSSLQVPGGWVWWVTDNMWHGFSMTHSGRLHWGTTSQLTLLRTSTFMLYDKQSVFDKYRGTVWKGSWRRQGWKSWWEEERTRQVWKERGGEGHKKKEKRKEAQQHYCVECSCRVLTQEKRKTAKL